MSVICPVRGLNPPKQHNAAIYKLAKDQIDFDQANHCFTLISESSHYTHTLKVKHVLKCLVDQYRYALLWKTHERGKLPSFQHWKSGYIIPSARRGVLEKWQGQAYPYIDTKTHNKSC